MSHAFENLTPSEEDALWAAAESQMNEWGLAHDREENGIIRVTLSDGSFVRRGLEDIAERAKASDNFEAAAKELVAAAFAPLNSPIVDPTTLDNEVFCSGLRLRLLPVFELAKDADYSATTTEHGLNLVNALTLDHGGMTAALPNNMVQNRGEVAVLRNVAQTNTTAALADVRFKKDPGVKGTSGEELFGIFTFSNSIGSSAVFNPEQSLPEAGVSTQSGFLWSAPSKDVLVIAPLSEDPAIFGETVATMAQYTTASFMETDHKISPCVYLTKGSSVETIAFPAPAQDGNGMVMGLNAPEGSVSAQHLGKVTN